MILGSSVKVALFFVVMLLAGCAIYTPRTETGQLIKPEWVNLGVSTDGLVLYELDKTSIQRSGSLVDFIDRKTILGSKKPYRVTYQYVSWQINCTQKTFRPKTIKIYNNNNQLIKESVYTSEEFPEQLISPNSASNRQMQLVCRSFF